MAKEFYYSIEKAGTAEYKDRGSKFIGMAFPINSVDDFKQQMMAVKAEHPKATHYCFAYRLGIDGTQFRVSDDGEPAGSAGRPILGQIDSRNLINTMIVVVRYFGGSLLGVPGLINAYKTAAAFALQVVPIVQKQVEVNYRLHFDYTMMNEVMTILKQFNCNIISQEVQLFCSITTGIPLNRLENVISRLKDIRGLDMQKQG